MKPGRTPCINPRCKRTADAAKFPDEMICGKCFKALPAEMKASFRHAWKQYNLHGRRIMRTQDEMKIVRLRNLQHFWSEKIHERWLEIRAHVTAGEKPEGLDNFMQDIGLC